MTMNFQKAYELAKIFVEENQPVVLWGEPGIGKSAMGQMIADALGFDELLVIPTSMLDAVDFNGCPEIIDGRTVFAPPAFWPLADDGKKWLIFFDEIDRAAINVGNAALRIYLDRMVGFAKLSDNVRIIAAGNGSTDSGTRQLGKAANNRFAHIHMTSERDQFCDYAIAKNFVPTIPAFIRYKGLSDGVDVVFDTKADRKAFAFATPRSWEAVNKIWHRTNKENRVDLVGALIGRELGGEIAAFHDIKNHLPDLGLIISDPDNAIVPDRLDIKFMLTGALAALADDSNFDSVCRFAKRLGKEMEIITIRDSVLAKPELIESAGYSAYCVENGPAHI